VDIWYLKKKKMEIKAKTSRIWEKLPALIGAIRYGVVMEERKIM
jgi:hypothetical protein